MTHGLLTITALVAGGLAAQFFAVLVIYRMMQELGTGQIKRAWERMLVFVAIFIAGYFAFLVQVHWGYQFASAEMIASAMFLSGAVFVAVVAQLYIRVFTR